MVISGRVPLLLLLGVAAVVVRPQVGTAFLWLGAVLLVVLVDRLLAPAPRDLTITRRDPGTVRLGDPATSTLVVANAGRRRVVVDVRDAWQPSAGATDNRHRLALRPGEQRLLSTPLLPRRRGDLRAAGVTVRSWGPLRHVARQASYDVAGMVRALPPFESRKHLPSRLARLRDLDGRAAIRVRGQGTEFDSLREYVRGDDVRSVDWRASARSPKVVVRTWQPERDRRVVLVLDTSRTSAGRVARGEGDDDRSAMPRLDAAMDAALLLGSLAARAGDRIDLLAGDRQVRARQRLSGARDVALRLQEQMADLDPAIAEADWDTLAAAVQALGRQRALVVLLTPLEPAAIADGLLPVLPALVRHHRVVLASVRDPALSRLADAGRAGDRTTDRTTDRIADLTVDQVYDAAAAAQEVDRRTRLREVLVRMGVDVVDADAEQLPPALADHYLALKARGLW